MHGSNAIPRWPSIVLARIVATLLPGEPEALGLLALMLHCEARRDARRDSNGAFVPLSEQDTHMWSRECIAEAERQLALAARLQRVGPFQLEAAIQSAHAQRGFGRDTPHAAIVALYEALVAIAPTIGARVGHAAAVAQTQGPEAAWSLLSELSPAQVRTYQPFWVVAAHLAQRLGRRAEAEDALRQAIGLSEDEAIRTYLRQQRDHRHP